MKPPKTKLTMLKSYTIIQALNSAHNEHHKQEAEMTAKVENLSIKRLEKPVYVSRSEKVCVNCIWYEQYYRKNRGNVALWIPTDKGYCILREISRTAMHEPCRSFENEKEGRDNGYK